jgi:hypothetical protein
VSGGDLTNCLLAIDPSPSTTAIWLDPAGTVAFLAFQAGLTRCTINADGTFGVCETGFAPVLGSAGDILVGGGGA